MAFVQACRIEATLVGVAIHLSELCFCHSQQGLGSLWSNFLPSCIWSGAASNCNLLESGEESANFGSTMSNENLPSTLPPSEVRFRRAIRSQNRLINFLAILLLPAFIGVWLSVADPLKTGIEIFWAVVVITILFQIVLYFLTMQYADTLPELHLENTELQELHQYMIEHISESDDYIAQLEAVNLLGAYWSTFQGMIAVLSPSNEDSFREACQIAISPMMDAAGILFDFEYGEIWSTSVYGFNESSGLLEPVWWKRSGDHPSGDNEPRSWRSGDGHVGSAFMQERILFTNDLTSDDAAMLLTPSASNVRDYDQAVYRSFVSAPIVLDVQPNPHRFGVLVVTSNVAGRFHEENKAVVAQAAQVLAHLFHWRLLANTPEMP
ncbi:GAF domain-containing protein [Sandarakinorhabdus sp.]|uniref:GAF domain-containing protein n=1 Tax=Sandarakinorhabdus sp. TaxID=1916663 RepID=UPI00286DC61C|nr:GAF domain-containing protein [Sandarakinorhabdus sp.]